MPKPKMYPDTATPVVYPIKHWSTSAMIDFLSNPLLFKKPWILLVPDDNSGMSAMIGKACHLALQTIFGGNDEVPVSPDLKLAVPAGIAVGLAYLDKANAAYIRYGKTGSREEMLKKYARAIQWYTDEMEDFNVVSVEEKLQEHLIGPDKQEFAIPMKGKSDLVVRKKNGKLRIIDHKFVSAYTNPDDESAIKIIQAMFLYFLVKAKYGERRATILSEIANVFVLAVFCPELVEVGFALLRECCQEFGIAKPEAVAMMERWCAIRHVDQRQGAAH